jgi:CRISPR-associated protein Cmr2
MTDHLWQVKLEALCYRVPGGISRDGLLKAVKRNGSVDPVVQQADELAWGADAAVLDLDVPAGSSILHPLSGRPLDLRPDVSRFNSDAARALTALSTGCSGARDLFLRLWQVFPDGLVPDAGPVGLLPVDPRLPARPWRLHATLTSALATCLYGGDDPAFLTFTIASAQEFIGTARRTQDYWMGSFILSWLVWESLQPVVEAFGPDCVLMPSLRGHPFVAGGMGAVPSLQPTAGNLANIWTALVPARRVDTIASECAERARRAWSDMVEAVRVKLDTVLQRPGSGCGGASAIPDCWQDAWERVKAGASEVVGSGIYWAAVPWRTGPPVNNFEGEYSTYYAPDNPPDYLRRAITQQNPLRMTFFEHMSLAARAVTARKHLRDIPQAREEGWRCTLCGLRQALTDAWPGPAPKDLWKKFSKHEDGGIKLKGRIRPNEQLCAACATKRLAWEHYFRGDHHLFPSTSTVAAAPFLKALLDRMSDRSLRCAVEEYCRCVEQLFRELDIPSRPESALPALKCFREDALARRFLELGGDWLYRESYEPEKLVREESKTLEDVQRCQRELGQALKAREALLRCARELQVKPARPSDYFAVLRMDGDGLGDWLAGTRALQLSARAAQSLREQVKGRGLDNLPASPVHVLAVAEGLSTFTVFQAPDIVDRQHLGVLVFAGGDELLALAPVEDAFGMALKLRQAFRGEQADGRLLMGERASITGAVVVAHRESPLSEAIEDATDLVDRAKAYEPERGGNLFAAAIARRGGELQEAYLPWDLDGRDTLSTLLDLATALREGTVAMSFLARLLSVLGQLGSTPDAVRPVVAHLLARHARPGVLAELPSFAEQLMGQMAARRPGGREAGLFAVRGFCLAARFLAREG